MKLLQLSCLVACLSLTACGWVDSTGAQGDNKQAVSSAQLVAINDGDSFTIDEASLRTVALTGSSSRVANWSWRLLEDQGNTESCLRFSGFNQAITSNSLSSSCLSSSDCTVNFTEKTVNGTTQFDVSVPSLRAPAALAFELTAENENGSPLMQRQTLCALSINEAPTAQDDVYLITPGETLYVGAADYDNLLANDVDDEDIRNEARRILEIPARAPTYASDFRLYDDGGFTFVPRSDIPLSVDGSVSDSFDYFVTDGSHRSKATVTIKVAESNQSPAQIANIATVRLSVEDADPSEVLLDMNDYFRDDDGDTLSYSVLAGSLPQSGKVYLTSAGLLFGQPTLDDVGSYAATVVVTDGRERLQADFEVDITQSTVPNRAPHVIDISNNTVSGSFTYDVSEFFSDADGDVMSFSAVGLPPGTVISRTGVISGTASTANRRTWRIVVTADDGRGGRTPDGFRLSIQ